MKRMSTLDLTQTLGNATTRRTLLKHLGAGALAAVAVPALPRLAAAQANADVETHVFASGVSAMPTEELVWRLVADYASPFGEGESLERALGFVMATNGPLHIVDDSAGTESYVQWGESAFVPEAVFERRESISQDWIPYLRIGLVPPEDAGYTAGGDFIYASDSFSAPSGERLIQLVGATLGLGEKAFLPDTGLQTLVLGTEGQFTLYTHGGGDPVGLRAGTAIAFATGMTLIGAESGKNRFMAALIGREV